jgi:hypothetical protein
LSWLMNMEQTPLHEYSFCICYCFKKFLHILVVVNEYGTEGVLMNITVFFVS